MIGEATAVVGLSPRSKPEVEATGVTVFFLAEREVM